MWSCRKLSSSPARSSVCVFNASILLLHILHQIQTKWHHLITHLNPQNCLIVLYKVSSLPAFYCVNAKLANRHIHCKQQRQASGSLLWYHPSRTPVALGNSWNLVSRQWHQFILTKIDSDFWYKYLSPLLRVPLLVPWSRVQSQSQKQDVANEICELQILSIILTLMAKAPLSSP